MKRFSLTIALLAMVALSGRSLAQTWYFYESFDNVAVDATGSGDIPDGFTLYNDANEPLGTLAYFDKAWKVVRSMNGIGYAAAPSSFKEQNAQADRWLVTPAISLKGASAPKLYFRAKADHSQARDGFVLKISTTTAEKSAFSNVRTIREAPNKWTDYIIDLSEYKGQTIYLAFVQNSTNMLMIDIDDIRVGETTTGLGAACNNAHTPLYMIHTHEGSGMSFPVSATLQNWSGTLITSARLCARMDNGAIIHKTFTGLEIQPAGTASLDKLSFSFDYIPQTANRNAAFEIWFDQINGENVSTDHSQVHCFVTEETELPYMQVLFEMFSSATCINCGPWNKLFHTWDSIIGGNDMSRPDGVVVAKFQVDVPYDGDPLVTDETEARRNYYAIKSAPTWMVNGRRFTLQGGSEDCPETYQAIMDSLAKFQRTPSPIALQARLNIAEDSSFMAEIKT
ncbi:MAG: choice-of-anchor J domain-containing protein, partial [Bacteroidales bacterium]|nr:choice-of-anchor J domain-containing protein [Bacteroidales bacterium]